MPSVADKLATIRHYYERPGTWLGYNILLGHSQHFGFYDAKHLNEKSAQKNFLKKFSRLLKLAPDMSVLDAGSGQGITAVYVAGCSNAHVTGVTVVPREVRIATKYAQKHTIASKVAFTLADYHALPFPDASFDRIYTTETLSYAYDLEKVVNEFIRVLKPNGRLVCAEYECDTASVEKREPEIGKFMIEQCGLHGFYSFKAGKFASLLRKVGFTHVNEHDWTKNIYPSAVRLKRIAAPVEKVIRALKLQNIAPNTTTARMFADWIDAGDFRYVVYTATKPKSSK